MYQLQVRLLSLYFLFLYDKFIKTSNNQLDTFNSDTPVKKNLVLAKIFTTDKHRFQN